MMLFALLKKDFLIVKKYVLIMLVVIVLIPPVMRWRTPEFTGVFGFILLLSVFNLMCSRYLLLLSVHESLSFFSLGGSLRYTLSNLISFRQPCSAPT